MKRSLTFIAFVVLPAFVVHAQAPATPHHHSLALEAQSVANGGTAKVSGNGSAKIEQMKAAFGGDPMQTEVSHVHEKRDTSSRTNLQVDIRNLGQAPDSAKLEWYFVAAPIGGHSWNAKEFVFDHGAQEVSIVANGADTRIITSKEARSVLERSATVLGGADGSGVSYVGGGNARGSTKQSGIILRGWFVRLTDSGQVIATRGSSQTYEDLAKDDAQLNTLLAQSASKAKH